MHVAKIGGRRQTASPSRVASGACCTSESSSFPTFLGTLAAIAFSPTPPGRIDTHHYVVPPGYRKWLQDKGSTAGGKAIPDWNPNAALDFMGSTNVQTAISTFPHAPLSG